MFVDFVMLMLGIAQCNWMVG